MYLGSKILSGAEVFGKNIKFDSGNIGMISGKLLILFIKLQKLVIMFALGRGAL